jgi:hypothetical protein
MGINENKEHTKWIAFGGTLPPGMAPRRPLLPLLPPPPSIRHNGAAALESRHLQVLHPSLHSAPWKYDYAADDNGSEALLRRLRTTEHGRREGAAAAAAAIRSNAARCSGDTREAPPSMCSRSVTLNG